MTEHDNKHVQNALKATKKRGSELGKADKDKPATGYQLGHLARTMRDHSRDDRDQSIIALKRTSLN